MLRAFESFLTKKGTIKTNRNGNEKKKGFLSHMEKRRHEDWQVKRLIRH
jgi:hypothetical protein